MEIKNRFKRLISNTQSVKFRYLVSLLSNGLSSCIFFLIGMILAQKLSPEGYGEYQYMIGLFISIFAFADFGSTAAFYTFISQKKRSLKFYLSYMIWQFLQLGIILGIIVIFSESSLKLIFVEHDKLRLLLAAAAVFLSNNMRTFINNIAESIRKTVVVQSVSLIFNVIHLSLIGIFIYIGMLKIEWIFGIMIVEYLIYYVLGVTNFFYCE